MEINIKPAKTLQPKPSSKDIIDAFLASGLQSAEIDHTGMDRSLSTINVSLRSYLQKHSELGISVRIQEGHIILEKDK